MHDLLALFASLLLEMGSFLDDLEGAPHASACLTRCKCSLGVLMAGFHSGVAAQAEVAAMNVRGLRDRKPHGRATCMLLPCKTSLTVRPRAVTCRSMAPWTPKIASMPMAVATLQWQDPPS